ncbi:MAG: hypothetical protein JSW33_12375 [bacterium]|nr:MAG: hypothetical protein JSW33_12375 [bacterium]
MNKIFIILIMFFIMLSGTGNPLSAQEEMPADTFYNFLDDFYQQLYRIKQLHDSSLSQDTNLEIQIRSWNDYLAQKLPRRMLVNVPVDEVTLGKEKFNRSEARMTYNFRLNIPKDHFQYENNIDSQNQFILKEVTSEKDSGDFLILEPQLKNVVVESNLAKTIDLLKNQSHLVFEIKMNVTRESGWLHFYQTVISFETVRWMIDEVVLWQLQSLPFEEIMRRKEK